MPLQDKISIWYMWSFNKCFDLFYLLYTYILCTILQYAYISNFLFVWWYYVIMQYTNYPARCCGVFTTYCSPDKKARRDFFGELWLICISWPLNHCILILVWVKLQLENLSLDDPNLPAQVESLGIIYSIKKKEKMMPIWDQIQQF